MEVENLRVRSKMDIALLPIFRAAERLFEFDCVGDFTKPESDGAYLVKSKH